MKDRLLKFLALALLTISITDCSEKNKFFDVTETSPLGNQNSMQDQYQKRWEKIYFRSINERMEGTEITSLRDLELPPDSKEIRIWAGFDTSPLRGLILKQNNQESSALFFPPLENSGISQNPRILSPPKNGWESLWDKLEKLEISTLSDPSDIAEIDGGSVIIEIKTSNSYKNYKYSGIEKNKTNNYKKILEICETLSREFDVDLLKYFSFNS